MQTRLPRLVNEVNLSKDSWQDFAAVYYAALNPLGCVSTTNSLFGRCLMSQYVAIVSTCGSELATGQGGYVCMYVCVLA